MSIKKLRANLLLLLTAFIWGMGFVAQSTGMESVGPLTFNGLRSILGGVALLPVSRFLTAKAPKAFPGKWPLGGGLICGIVFLVATTLQQYGILYSSVGKAGFITTLYVIFVPILGLLLRKRVSVQTWFCVLLAVIGMYLLCVKDTSLAINFGDVLLLISAVVYAVHILAIDRFVPQADCVRLSCMQFLICGVISTAGAFVLETVRVTDVLAAGIPILYAGLLSCGVAYTLQIVAQKDTDPTSAALICSMEAVFALLGGWIILHEAFSLRELIGCAITFAAILLSQLPIFQNRKAG